MNWKKLIVILFGVPLIICIICIMLFVSYIYLEKSGILDSYNTYLLQNKLRQAIVDDIKVIHLQDFTNFNWDKVYINYEYNNKECYSDKDYVDLTFYDRKKEIKMRLRNNLCSKYDNYSCSKEFYFSNKVNIPVDCFGDRKWKCLNLDKAYYEENYGYK